MNTILIILLLWCLIVVSFFWGIYKALLIENMDDAPVRDEDCLLKNEPNYLGQGRWIKE